MKAAVIYMFLISAQLVENIAEDTHILKSEPKKVIAEVKYKGEQEPTLMRLVACPKIKILEKVDPSRATKPK